MDNKCISTTAAFLLLVMALWLQVNGQNQETAQLDKGQYFPRSISWVDFSKHTPVARVTIPSFFCWFLCLLHVQYMLRFEYGTSN